MILAIDPGTTESAYVILDEEERVVRFGKIPNHDMLHIIATRGVYDEVDSFVVEMIASYGMPVGREVFETCVWIGRFVQQWSSLRKSTPHVFMYRAIVKHHLCHSSKANDGTIRQAIVDRYGGKEKAIGKKKTQGPLHGISGDVWAALAVALTWHDQQRQVAA